MIVSDWSKYAPWFKKTEFDCKHTGENFMTSTFMGKLLELRKYYDRPMVITSGYRDVTHPVEAVKSSRGEHTFGNAADIFVPPEDSFLFCNAAMHIGFVRLGVSQRAGKARFVHIGLGGDGLPAPRIWSY